MAYNSEQQPLLDESGYPRDSLNAPETSEEVIISPRKRVFIYVLCILVIFIQEIGGIVESIPLSQLTERIICQKFSDQTLAANLSGVVAPGPGRCKETDVQREFATIFAWRSSIETIPAVLLSIPFGIMADKFGRPYILSLSLLGQTLYCIADAVVCAYPAIFPIRMVAFTSIFTIIGGGTTPSVAIIFSIINGLVSPAQRSTSFFLMWALTLAGKVVATWLAYLTMAVNDWVAMYVAIASYCLCTILALCIPNFRDPILANRPSSSVVGRMTPKPTLRERSLDAVRSVIPLLRQLAFGNKSAILILVAFFITSISRYGKRLELQYITNRFGQSWAEAALLLNYGAATSIIFLLAILPATSQLLLSWLKLRPVTKDLVLFRAHYVVLTLGSIFIAAANGIPLLVVGIIVTGMGVGYKLLANSLLTFLATDENTTMLYTTVSVVESVGEFIAGPFIASVFNLGLTWGREWIGLPYFVIAALYGIALVLVWFVRLDDTPRPDLIQSRESEVIASME